MTSYHRFTSESVSEGHPDKMADQISDAVLDEILKQDPNARVACEVFLKTSLALVGGEITTSANVDIEAITRNVVKEIGYDDNEVGFDYKSCCVLTSIGKQSSDIAMGVDETKQHEQGAGDQGLMFGYASRETPALMPAPIYYAHALMKQQSQLRKQKKLAWLRPDAKAQVTIVYENDQPVHVDNIVLSTQHSPDIAITTLREAVIEEIVKPIIPKAWINNKTIFHINPTGRFVTGGPLSDCGLTGRKIIVDTYGGMARHGGGAMSGKDPSKVDRSAAYAARYIAKNMVAAGLADKLEIQISYAIGVAQPTSIAVNSFGTGRYDDDEKLAQIITEHFSLTPKGIITSLNLLRPIYRATAAYGHFGQESLNFTWEITDKVEALQSA